MSRKTLYLTLALLFLLFSACVPKPPINPTPPIGADTAQWQGEWEEDWPGASERDVYRIDVSADGITIQVTPVTNAERQNLANLRWDGRTLSFTNYINNRELAYNLAMDATGNRLVGTVALPEGETKNITWYKRGFGPANTDTLPPLVAQYNATLEDWVGDWEEDWPNSTTKDRYRIEINLQTSSATITPLTNLGKQKLSNVRLAGNSLTFTLQFNEVVYEYQLVPMMPNLLEGRVVERDSDKIRKITWRRVAMAQPPKPEVDIPASWQGVFEEFWPDREDKDLYIILVKDGRAEIKPLTNESKQTIANVHFDGEELTFQLQFNENVIQYSLKKQSEINLSGIAKLSTGRDINVAWSRLNKNATPPINMTQLQGTWEEYWPNTENRDIYQIQVVNRKFNLRPMSNLNKQKLSNLNFSGSTITFTLVFNDIEYTYFLNVKDSNWINGTVRKADGKTYDVNWIKVDEELPPIGFKAWSGIWEERWPGRDQRDVYRLTATNAKTLKVEPLTNLEKQKIVNVEFDGQKLFFLLRFEEKLIEYHLVMQNKTTLRGTVILSDGTTKNLEWKRTGN